jgi:hypothetical protein
MSDRFSDIGRTFATVIVGRTEKPASGAPREQRVPEFLRDVIFDPSLPPIGAPE